MPEPTRSKAVPLDAELTSSHWGAFSVERNGGQPTGLRPLAEDPHPSPIGPAMWQAYQSDLRIRKPAARAGWLEAYRRRAAATGQSPEHAHEHAPEHLSGHRRDRGREPFVELEWDEALDMAAAEIGRVIRTHGNEAVFGGSYGWSSAGRFHHAQSQVHRFLNALGGYVRHVDSYSLGAGRVVMPHVVDTMDRLMVEHHSWDVLAAHTRLFVTFGGAPAKNSQIGQGGASRHWLPEGLANLARAGCRFVNFSPVREDIDVGVPGAVEWIPIRPNTDVAAMLAMACELVLAGRHDEAFLERYCVGFARWRDYLLGRQDGQLRNADWAAPICGVPAERLRAVATALAANRSMVNVAWSLQRADHGEQAFWAGVGLACVLGQVGLPGGGFGVAYGPTNSVGSPGLKLPNPTLPQGANAVSKFIPVARIADLLLTPGGTFDYNGQRHTYADIRLVYWAGGNPFHHHQDLNRLAQAWRRPETVIVNEQVWNSHARMADLVFPATSTLERDDIGSTARDPLVVAMKRLRPPPGEARDDYAIFTEITRRLGKELEFTEGRDVAGWLRALYERNAAQCASAGVELPPFDEFWASGGVRLPAAPDPVVMLEAFRRDPLANPLPTPSGRIELFSERVAGFSYDDCPGYPAWFEPAEWLGSPQTERFPLHLISDQPHTKLHSQLDFSSVSMANKVHGREPVWLHPDDALARGIADGDLVRLFNDRGQCLAGARLTDALRPSVVKLSTGAWWDPVVPGEPGTLDRHGNPNVLTRDVGASRLSQGCSAQTCLVQIERWEGPAPPMQAFTPPEFVQAGTGRAPD